MPVTATRADLSAASASGVSIPLYPLHPTKPLCYHYTRTRRVLLPRPSMSMRYGVSLAKPNCKASGQVLRRSSPSINLAAIRPWIWLDVNHGKATQKKKEMVPQQQLDFQHRRIRTYACLSLVEIVSFIGQRVRSETYQNLTRAVVGIGVLNSSRAIKKHQTHWGAWRPAKRWGDPNFILQLQGRG